MHFKVIVPLYNVEKWIKVCIRSVKAQTHKDFHCVLIDDASTDNSATIIENEIKNDSRFTFIKNEKKTKSWPLERILMDFLLEFH